MEACNANRSKGCCIAVPQVPIRKLSHQIDIRTFRVVACTSFDIVITTNGR
jgi:hypothetical protein